MWRFLKDMGLKLRATLKDWRLVRKEWKARAVYFPVSHDSGMWSERYIMYREILKEIREVRVSGQYKGNRFEKLSHADFPGTEYLPANLSWFEEHFLGLSEESDLSKPSDTAVSVP